MDTIRLTMAATLLAAAGLAFAQDDNGEFTSIQEQMTAKEFVDAGLHELSQDQLEALNAWLRNHMAARPGGAAPASDGQQVAAAEDRRGLHARDEADIHSRIIGEFDGWDGYSEFHLENGMVWQQVASDTMGGVHMTSPRVRIYKGMLGWRLEVEGINKTTPVRRIK